MLPHARLVVPALLLCCAVPGRAAAEVVRFRFAPVDMCGTAAQVPIGPGGALGERLIGLGFLPQPYATMPRPNQMVTFRHPYSGQNITVPLTLPAGTPRLEHRSNRIVYNYGSYTVQALFLPDGSVEVTYNSGFLRPLQFE